VKVKQASKKSLPARRQLQHGEWLVAHFEKDLHHRQGGSCSMEHG